MEVIFEEGDFVFILTKQGGLWMLCSTGVMKKTTEYGVDLLYIAPPVISLPCFNSTFLCRI